MQLSELEQIVEDDIGDFATPELDHHAHTRLVRLVAQIGDAVELLVANEFADTREQRRLVHLIGNFVDDDGLPVAPLQVLDVRSRADHDAAATGAVALAHALGAEDDARRREIRRRYMLDQFVDRDVRVFEQRQTRGNDFGQVVRRDVRRHPDSDA